MDDVIADGPGLVFVVFPHALAKMPVPQLWWVYEQFTENFRTIFEQFSDNFLANFGKLAVRVDFGRTLFGTINKKYVK